MNSMKFDYDLVCIGSGPAGQRDAVQAAKLGKRVAIIEKQRAVGRRLPAYRDDSEQNVSRSRPVIREYRERAVERRLG